MNWNYASTGHLNGYYLSLYQHSNYMESFKAIFNPIKLLFYVTKYSNNARKPCETGDAFKIYMSTSFVYTPIIMLEAIHLTPFGFCYYVFHTLNMSKEGSMRIMMPILDVQYCLFLYFCYLRCHWCLLLHLCIVDARMIRISYGYGGMMSHSIIGTWYINCLCDYLYWIPRDGISDKDSNGCDPYAG
eukprot:414892_1